MEAILSSVVHRGTRQRVIVRLHAHQGLTKTALKTPSALDTLRARTQTHFSVELISMMHLQVVSNHALEAAAPSALKA